VAGERPRLVDLPQPLLGQPDPGVEVDDPAYPRIDVYGSSRVRARLRRACPTDLHRPFIDDLTRPNPDDPTGGARRCAGSRTCSTAGSSRARCRSPRCTTRSRTRDWFEHHFPGDFIVEYIGQTRGWFYTLHVLATALFDRPAFKTCICHGIVLGSTARR
jgi:isoleucyl-tRNA synthetase